MSGRWWEFPSRWGAVGLALALSPQALGYSWENCGDASQSELQLFSITDPPPFVIGEPVRVNAQIGLTEVVSAAWNDVDVVVDHKVNGQVLPCMAPYVGSCTYERALSLASSDCEIVGTPTTACSGPFNRGGRVVSDRFTLGADGAMLLGHNDVTVRVYNHNRGDQLACVRFAGVVERCDDSFPPCTGPDCEPRYCLGIGAGWGPEVCANGIDDDGDQQTDELAGTPGIEADCDDGLDDDCDGVADAADTDCVDRGSVLVEPTLVGAASCAQAGLQTLTLTVDNGAGVRTEVYACDDEAFFTSAASGALTLTVSGTSADGTWTSGPVEAFVSGGQSETASIVLTCTGCP